MLRQECGFKWNREMNIKKNRRKKQNEGWKRKKQRKKQIEGLEITVKWEVKISNVAVRRRIEEQGILMIRKRGGESLK